MNMAMLVILKRWSNISSVAAIAQSFFCKSGSVVLTQKYEVFLILPNKSVTNCNKESVIVEEMT